MAKMFSKILIANRGEIACRIMRSAHAMGIKTVAVYSEADARAVHVEMADEAVLLGPAASSESYLRGDKIIEAAQQTGAEAIHPGYGFLSENARFVEAVEAAGLAFIGPGSHAIEVMGDKITSKKLALEAGVSVVPGSEGEVASLDAAMAEATRIGFPVMVKASAGGGGKGMRVIERAEDLAEGMSAAMNEAQNAFGDNRVFIEKFVLQPRHIEIQLLADTHGNAVYLGERECSIQRRHQKVIEEAPSPFISDETRKAMGEQAVQLAKACGYRSAGTVEFIVGADQDFYFLEMNTRLQVEHPVTEEVYGLDLVEWMIKIAAGEKLTLKQQDITPQAWSIEARVYAEDSAKGFLPSIGQLSRYRAPVGEGIRVDSGVAEGRHITMFYDPMIAKLIATGKTRLEAIEKLELALDHYQLEGLEANRQFISAILANEAFRAGHMTTHFIAEYFGDRFIPEAPTGPLRDKLIALGVAATAIQHAEKRFAGASETEFVVLLQEGDAPIQMTASWQPERDGEQIYLDGQAEPHRISGALSVADPLFDGQIDDMALAVQITRHASHITLRHGPFELKMQVLPARTAPYLQFMPVRDDAAGDREVRAPMPGLLVKLMVSSGDLVEAGQPLAIIEAMKMENIIKAGVSGAVEKIHADAGASLNVDDLILTLASDAQDDAKESTD